MSIPSVVSGGGTPTVNAGVAEITDTMKAVSKDYLSLLSTTTTRQGNTDLDAVRIAFNADTFATDTVGTNGTNEFYNSVGDFYNAIPNDTITILDDFEGYADTAGLAAEWVESHTYIDPELETTIYKTGVKAMKISLNAASNGRYVENTLASADDWTGPNKIIKMWARTSDVTFKFEFNVFDANASTWRTLLKFDWQGNNQSIDTWYEYEVDLSKFPDNWLTNITKIAFAVYDGAATLKYFYVDDIRIIDSGGDNMILCGDSNVPVNKQPVDAAYLSFHAQKETHDQKWDDMESYANTDAIKAIWIPSDNTKYTVTLQVDAATPTGHPEPDAGQGLYITTATGCLGETVTKTFTAEDWSDVESIRVRQDYNGSNADFIFQIYDSVTAHWYVVKDEDHSESGTTGVYWDKIWSLSHISPTNRTGVTKAQFVCNTSNTGMYNKFAIIRLVRENGTYTLNADIKGFVTVDGGTNWNEITLTNEGALDGVYSRITGFKENIAVPGSNVKYKIQTYNNKMIRIRDVSLWWPESSVVEITPQVSPTILLNKGREYGTDPYYEFFDPMIYGHNTNNKIHSASQDFDLNNRLFMERYAPHATSGCYVNNSNDINALYRRFPCIQLKMPSSGNISLNPQWAVAPDGGWDNIYMEFDMFREAANNHQMYIGFGADGVSPPRCGIEKDATAYTGHIHCNDNPSPEITSLITSETNTWETWKIILRMDSVGVTSVEFWIDSTMKGSHAYVAANKGQFPLYPILYFSYSGSSSDICLKNLHIKAVQA